MKLKSLFIATLVLSGLAAGQASAQDSEKSSPNYPNCSLAASHSYVPVGQSYNYSIRVSFSDFGPPPPPTFQPFTVVFYGTKNGVSDIGPEGETYPSNIPGRVNGSTMRRNRVQGGAPRLAAASSSVASSRPNPASSARIM